MLSAVGIAEAAIEVLTDSRNLIREYVFDVCSALQILIMVGKYHSVLCGLQVTFQIVCAHVSCPAPRSFGLFRSPIGGTTVCHTSIKRHIVTNFSHLRRNLLHCNTLCICVLIGELLLIRTRGQD